MVLPRIYNDVGNSTSTRKNFHRLPPLTVPGPDTKCSRGDKPHPKPVDLPKWSVPQRQTAPIVKNVSVLPTWEYRILTAPKTYPEKNKPKETRTSYPSLRLGPVHKYSDQSSSLEIFELPTVTSNRMMINPRCCNKNSGKCRCRKDRATKHHAPDGWGIWLSHRVPEDYRLLPT